MSTSGRVAALDLLRGGVMVLMALDHTRDFFQPLGTNPEDLATTTLPLFATRWVTHFCAPVFVFLAGVSVALYRQRDGAAAATRFLLTRGLWLMLLEATWVTFSWFFDFDLVHLGVLWAIGGSMVLLAALAWLPRRSVLGLGLTLTLLLAAFPVDRDTWLLGLLCQPRGFELLGQAFHQSYAIVPWFGVIAVGYGVADLLTSARAGRWLPVAGLGAIAAFTVLRGFNAFGDPAPWSIQARGPLVSAMAFLSPSKYPPSLLFQLMTLGPVLIALPLLGRWRGPTAVPLLVFGRVPLFFYLVHLPLAHLGGMLYALARHGEPRIPAEAPLSLPLIYGAWGLLLVVLFPACWAWGRLKRARRGWWWLRYL